MNTPYFRGYGTDQRGNIDYALVIILPFRLFGLLQLLFWQPSIFPRLWIRTVELLNLLMNILMARFGELSGSQLKTYSDQS